jgi:hypothetical protein
MCRGLAIATTRACRAEPLRVTATVTVTATVSAVNAVTDVTTVTTVTAVAAATGTAPATPPVLPSRGPPEVFAALTVVATRVAVVTTRVTVVRPGGAGSLARPAVRLRTHVNYGRVGGRWLDRYFG